MLLSEADIVAAQSSAKISDLFLIDEQIYRSASTAPPEPAGGWAALIAKRFALRDQSGAAAAIAEADVIVYGRVRSTLSTAVLPDCWHSRSHLL